MKTEPINYDEAEKVKAVTEILGIKIVAHADIPSGEAHLVQNGRLVGKVVNVK